MGFLDNLLGRSDDRRPAPATAPAVPSADAQAVERYRYMLQTAPPETLEQAHAEAFARLTPEQRRMVLGQLTAATPPHEREAAAAVSADDPRGMGRLATRAEMREPGFLERSFGGGGGGGGFGGSLMASFAMGFVGSMVAQSFMSSMAGGGAEQAALDNGPPADAEDVGGSGDDGGDLDGGDFDGGDFGGDF
jgi:hypothetical protein